MKEVEAEITEGVTNVWGIFTAQLPSTRWILPTLTATGKKAFKKKARAAYRINSAQNIEILLRIPQKFRMEFINILRQVDKKSSGLGWGSFVNHTLFAWLFLLQHLCQDFLKGCS